MAPTSDTTQVDWRKVEQSAEFQALRSGHRRFVFPISIAFIVWYFAFVLLAAYNPTLMATPVFGNINLGLVLGLLQFVTTFAITGWYVSWANKTQDPQAEAIAKKLEAGESK